MLKVILADDRSGTLHPAPEPLADSAEPKGKAAP